MNELIRKLKLIRHTQVIKDPFPTKTDKNISIYKAYQTGYDKAYSEIESVFLKEKEMNDYITKGMNATYDEMISDIKKGLESL